MSIVSPGSKTNDSLEKNQETCTVHFQAVLQATLNFFVYFDSVKWSKPGEAGLTFWSNTGEFHTDDDYESADSTAQ